jgi:hypothetical protein
LKAGASFDFLSVDLPAIFVPAKFPLPPSMPLQTKSPSSIEDGLHKLKANFTAAASS